MKRSETPTEAVLSQTAVIFIHCLFSAGSRFYQIQAITVKWVTAMSWASILKWRKAGKYAASKGRFVTAIKEDSDKGGLKDEYLSEGNHIIKHNDGSEAVIGTWQKRCAGKCGRLCHRRAAYRLQRQHRLFRHLHLHFQVYDAGGKNIATRFRTKKEIQYLRPGKWYKRSSWYATATQRILSRQQEGMAQVAAKIMQRQTHMAVTVPETPAQTPLAYADVVEGSAVLMDWQQAQ